MTEEEVNHFPGTCICGESDSQSSSVREADIPGDMMWSLIDGKHIVSLPHHDGLFVDRVDD